MRDNLYSCSLHHADTMLKREFDLCVGQIWMSALSQVICLDPYPALDKA